MSVKALPMVSLANSKGPHGSKSQVPVIWQLALEVLDSALACDSRILDFEVRQHISVRRARATFRARPVRAQRGPVQKGAHTDRGIAHTKPVVHGGG
jgi:hypothetical protein